MKKISILLIFIAQLGFAQSSADVAPPSSSSTDLTMRDVLFAENHVTYLGIDFSLAKFIAPAGTWNPDLLSSLCYEWNELVTKEGRGTLRIPSIAKILRIKKDNFSYRDDITRDTYPSLKLEKQIFFQPNFEKIEQRQIMSLVSNYNYKDLTGIGLMVVLESFDKFEEYGNMHVVFIDMDNKAVIYSERLNGRPKGAGYRNYWGQSVSEVFYEIEGRRYKQWKKELDGR